MLYVIVSFFSRNNKIETNIRGINVKIEGWYRSILKNNKNDNKPKKIKFIKCLFKLLITTFRSFSYKKTIVPNKNSQILVGIKKKFAEEK